MCGCKGQLCVGVDVEGSCVCEGVGISCVCNGRLCVWM